MADRIDDVEKSLEDLATNINDETGASGGAGNVVAMTTTTSK